MDEKELEIAQQLGKQVWDGLPLYCPRCQIFAGPKDGVQPLASFGDNREVLFCPHCDLTVQLIVDIS